MLIIQLRTDESLADFDRMIAIEDGLIQAYAQNRLGVVDGHDFGSGQMSIFVFPTASWRACIEIAMAYLRFKNLLGRAVVAKRLENETYKIVWPHDFADEFRLI